MSSESSTGNQLTLSDIGALLLRRWRVILACILLFGLMGVALARLAPDNYSATTTLVVSPLMADPSVADSSRDSINIATEREIIESKAVARLALEKIGESPEGAADLIDNLNVVAPDGSQVLHVTVTDGSAQRAADLSGAVADAYLEFRQEGGAEVAQRFIEHIDERVAELSQADDTIAREQIRELTDQRRLLALFGQDPGRVIGRANPPTSAAGPGTVTFGAAGLVGGGLIGIAVALIRERTDRRIRTAPRLAQAIGSEPVAVRSLDDDESLRWLRRTIMADPDRAPRSVLVVGVEPKLPDFAGALARAVHRTGRDTRVINAHQLSTDKIDSAAIGLLGDVDEVTLIDATAVASRTSISELAELADIALIVCSPKSATAAVADLARLIADTSTASVGVFVSSTTASRSPASTGSGRGPGAGRLTEDDPADSAAPGSTVAGSEAGTRSRTGRSTR